MEPMLMGSPQSPNARSPHIGSPGQSYNVLPAYLLGDTSIHHSPPHGMPRSPQPVHSGGLLSGSQSPRNQHARTLFSQSSKSPTKTSPKQSVSASPRVPSGPPVRTYEELEQSRKLQLTSPAQSSMLTPAGDITQPLSSYSFDQQSSVRGLDGTQGFDLSAFTPDPEEKGEKAAEGTWVTVFGFPPSSATFVLHQLTQLGQVEKHHVATGGNWMHVKFTTRYQATKALGLNGKVLAPSVMIGVKQCTDKEVMSGEASCVSVASPLSFTMGQSSSAEAPSSTPRNMALPQAQLQVLQQNIPQRTGFFTRLFHHVLGY